jgi:hypothetical protein
LMHLSFVLSFIGANPLMRLDRYDLHAY